MHEKLGEEPLDVGVKLNSSRSGLGLAVGGVIGATIDSAEIASPATTTTAGVRKADDTARRQLLLRLLITQWMRLRVRGP